MNIVDKKLTPYVIRKNKSNYDVVEDTFRVNKKGEPIEELHGHFTSVESALSKIIRLKVEVNNTTYNLAEYISKIKAVKEILISE